MNDAHIHRTTHLHEALNLLREGVAQGQPWIPMAVGRDLDRWCHARDLHLDRILDLTPIAALQNLTESEGAIHLGAATTYRELTRAPMVRAFAPILSAAARWGGPHPRPTRPTLGGSVTDGLPAPHLVLALAISRAELTLVSADGLREILFDDFFDENGDTHLQPDELLLSVSVPKLHRSRLRFGRFAQRQTDDPTFTCASLGVRLDFDHEGVITDAMIAVGEARGVLWRLHDAEQLLVGASPSPETATQASQRVLEALSDALPPRLAARLARMTRSAAARPFRPKDMDGV